MSRALTVWWDGRPVGVLRLDEHGDMTFTYGADWLGDAEAPPISVSLPKQAERFDRARTRPFFAGLLPEEGPREAAARTLGVSRQNDFGLLEGLGGDVAGALSLWPEGESVPQHEASAAHQVKDAAALAEILLSLPRRPLLAGEKGIRLSLAGAQPKLPVVLTDGDIALPAPGQPTTHIIKPAPREYPTFPENEAFCMRLAAALGLDVASVQLRRAQDHLYLLVERYDRIQGEDGVPRRLHQEDFCQALGVTPEHKYASERGPSFSQSFDLLRQVTRIPATAVLALLDAAIFNVVIGNADAHGKNFSLLYSAEGARLSPLYDLLCTSYYPEVHANMAMRMGGVNRLEDFTVQTLREFAGQVQLAPPYVVKRARELARRAVPAAGRVVEALAEEGFDTETVRDIAQHIGARSEVLLRSTGG